MTNTAQDKTNKSFGITLLCYIATAAFVLFPVITFVAVIDGIIPKEKMFPLIAMEFFVGVIALVAAIFVSFRRDKAERTKALTSKRSKPRTTNPTLAEFLVILAIVLPMGIGILYLAGDLVRNQLAKNMTSEANVYDMSSAIDVEPMVEAMLYPVTRAVLVQAHDGGKHVVCAVNETGVLEVFAVTRTGDNPMLRQHSLHGDLKASAPAFCSAAFARLDAAVIKDRN